MERLRGNLRDDGGGENADKDEAANRIAQIHRHCYGIAAGLSQCRRKHLDDPKPKSDFGYFAQRARR